MKILKVFGLLPLLGMFLFSSCSEEDAVITLNSLDGTLAPIKIEIPVGVVTPSVDLNSLRSDVETLNTFEGSITLNISDQMFAGFQDYLSAIQSFKVKGVEVTVTGSDNGQVQDLVLTVGNQSRTISQYTFGTTYKGDSQMIALVQSVFSTLLPPTSSSVNVSVNGKTDAEAGTVLKYGLKIDYEISVPVLDNKTKK